MDFFFHKKYGITIFNMHASERFWVTHETFALLLDNQSYWESFEDLKNYHISPSLNAYKEKEREKQNSMQWPLIWPFYII